jgi:cyclohexyl-isocyanide hydratase
LKVGILLFQGVEELDFAGVYEVLAKARLYECALEVKTIAKESLIQCANGLVVVPHESLANIYSYDVLIVPGGRGISRIMEDKEICELIAKFNEKRILCSVCTGAFLLAKAGVLKGKVATTHHDYLDKLARFCHVVQQRVVEDGRIITCGGVSASIDLGLKIIEKLCGHEVAKKVAERIEWPYQYVENE